MIKKLSVLSLFLLLDLIIACCPDPLTFTDNIDDIELSNSELQKSLSDSSEVSEPDLRIRLKLNVETHELAQNSGIFINSAFATSCEDNFIGLQSDIIDFKITCNKLILGTEPDMPISSELIRVYKVGFYDDSENFRKTVTEWLTILNKGGYQRAYEWYFEFNEPLQTNDFIKFTVTLEQENGNLFTATTSSVRPI